MFAFICQFVLFAEGEVPPADANNPLRLGLLMLGAVILFYFIVLMPQKKKEQAVRQKVNELKENDRVITIGGIHGVVTNVQRDAERVTIRVDEATGTKIRFNLSAIARVVTDDEADKAAGGTKS